MRVPKIATLAELASRLSLKGAFEIVVVSKSSQFYHHYTAQYKIV